MKKYYFIVVVLLAITLSGCSDQKTPEQICKEEGGTPTFTAKQVKVVHYVFYKCEK